MRPCLNPESQAGLANSNQNLNRDKRKALLTPLMHPRTDCTNRFVSIRACTCTDVSVSGGRVMHPQAHTHFAVRFLPTPSGIRASHAWLDAEYPQMHSITHARCDYGVLDSQVHVREATPPHVCDIHRVVPIICNANHPSAIATWLLHPPGITTMRYHPS